MSSGRYKSRLFNLISQQSRRLSDQMGLRLRQAKLAATWGAQIVLYPVYALLQTTRLVNRQIQQTVQQAVPRLRATIHKPDQAAAQHPDESIASGSPEIPAADTPILRSLAAVAQFALPIASGAVVTAEPQDALLTRAPKLRLSTRSATAALPSRRSALAKTHTRLVQSASSDLADAAPDAAIAASPQTAFIRGIASLLETRSLVLTTAQNQILDILTPQQQQQLQQRLAWELADYWHSRKLAAAAQPSLTFRQRFMLPPLSAEPPHLLPPVRLLRRLMAWMQTSPVAVAADLFQESALTIAPSSNFIAAAIERSEWEPELKELERKQLKQPLPMQPRPGWKQWMQRFAAPAFAPVAEGQSAEGQSAEGQSALVVSRPAMMAQPQARSQRQLQLWQRTAAFTSITPLQSHRRTPMLAQGAKAALPEHAHAHSLIADSSIAGSLAAVSAVSGQAAKTAIVSIAQPPAGTQNLPVAAPTWIEAEARIVGYVKHPLEQVLEWLDRAMLWLEKATVKLWQWLRG
jgi:hypothetical protein